MTSILTLSFRHFTNQNLSTFRHFTNQNLSKLRHFTKQNLSKFRHINNQKLSQFKYFTNQNFSKFRNVTNQKLSRYTSRSCRNGLLQLQVQDWEHFGTASTSARMGYWGPSRTLYSWCYCNSSACSCPV